METTNNEGIYHQHPDLTQKYIAHRYMFLLVSTRIDSGTLLSQSALSVSIGLRCLSEDSSPALRFLGRPGGIIGVLILQFSLSVMILF